MTPDTEYNVNGVRVDTTRHVTTLNPASNPLQPSLDSMVLANPIHSDQFDSPLYPTSCIPSSLVANFSNTNPVEMQSTNSSSFSLNHTSKHGVYLPSPHSSEEGHTYTNYNSSTLNSRHTSSFGCDPVNTDPAYSTSTYPHNRYTSTDSDPNTSSIHPSIHLHNHPINLHSSNTSSTAHPSSISNHPTTSYSPNASSTHPSSCGYNHANDDGTSSRHHNTLTRNLNEIITSSLTRVPQSPMTNTGSLRETVQYPETHAAQTPTTTTPCLKEFVHSSPRRVPAPPATVRFLNDQPRRSTSVDTRFSNEITPNRLCEVPRSPNTTRLVDGTTPSPVPHLSASSRPTRSPHMGKRSLACDTCQMSPRHAKHHLATNDNADTHMDSTTSTSVSLLLS